MLDILNRKLVQIQDDPLSPTEILVLQGIWQDKTYEEIAKEERYSSGYVTNVVAPQLYQKLGQVFGRRITKKNCRAVLESQVAAQVALEAKPPRQNPSEFYPDVNEDTSPHYPDGSVPLNSPFYIERSTIEASVYTEIQKPGALVRIKAPREMGKTSLLLRALDYANHLGYYTVSLNLEQIDLTFLSDVNQFLRWLCASVSHKLQIEPKLDDYWNKDLGNKQSCTFYFRNYLLKQIDAPLVLALDEVNQIFEHPEVAKNFLPLLRSWYEEAKRQPIWQKLRLIVVHSTEIYVPLQLQQSPFNVGLPIQLTDFSLEQVCQLAQRYGLKWTDGSEAKQLMAMIGGHPGLVHTALYHLGREEITLAQLLETAHTSTGIYAHHLQRHWVTLQEQPKLASALHTVISATEPVKLEPIIAYKLSSMGLIKLDNNKATPSRQLYQWYFENQRWENQE